VDNRVGGRERWERERERVRVAVEGGEGEEDGRCEDGGSGSCGVRLKMEIGFRLGAASHYIGY
jgi:hypothetical protein